MVSEIEALGAGAVSGIGSPATSPSSTSVWRPHMPQQARISPAASGSCAFPAHRPRSSLATLMRRWSFPVVVSRWAAIFGRTLPGVLGGGPHA
jgi:hypothetical protein